MNAYNFDDGELQEFLNAAKEQLLEQLEEDHILPPGASEKLAAQYVLALRSKGWFGKIYDKLRGEVGEHKSEIVVLKDTRPVSEESSIEKI